MIEKRVGDYTMGEKRFAYADNAAAERELARIMRRERRQRWLGVLFGLAAGYLLGRPLLDLLSN